ncbi:MAG: MYXO-CTERM domain-containing protein, partial [Bradymonadia bacterium]
FNLVQEFDDNCIQAQNRGGAPSAAGGDFDNDGVAESDPGVAVLSREAIGPYDRVIIAAQSTQALRDWLDQNDFAIPDSIDATLAPYIEMGSVFVAIKLLPGNDDGDIAPLHLTFTSDKAAVPIVPTQVAANPDMGVIVHVLADDRAIPVNYDHVRVNEGAIDWLNFGQNYADVVSAAVDEAQAGRGFVTDYAGSSAAIADMLTVIDDGTLQRVEQAESVRDLFNILPVFNDNDLQRILSPYVVLPEGVPAAQFWTCPDCWGPVENADGFDGASIAAQIQVEVNAPRKTLGELFSANDYLTRLYTTLSPNEMVLDPIFGTNPDLGEVDRQRTATQYIICDGDGNTLDSLSYVETPSGIQFHLDGEGQVPGAIQRQDGETVRGQSTPAAQVIEKMFEQGQPEAIDNRTRLIEVHYGTNAKDDSCTVAVGESQGAPIWMMALGGLIALRRRRG